MKRRYRKKCTSSKWPAESMFKVERSGTFGNVGIRWTADRFKVPYIKLQNRMSKNLLRHTLGTCDKWMAFYCNCVLTFIVQYVRDCSFSQTEALGLLHCNWPSSYIFTERRGINVPWNGTEKLVDMEQSSNFVLWFQQCCYSTAHLSVIWNCRSWSVFIHL